MLLPTRNRFGTRHRGYVATSTSLSATAFTEYSSAGAGDELPAAGAGFRYYLKKLLVTPDVAALLTILSGSNVILAAHRIPADGGFLPLTDEDYGLEFGEDEQPNVSLSAAAGGNVVAQISAWFVKGPK